ncbi:MAG: hypothetical protein H6738_22765 [Alphaproteobacteria bacterium]|nr:hypothetical protein [Alphaproteobacteria bacterium]
MGERIDGILVITDRAPPVRTPEPAPRLDAMDAPAIPARFTPEPAESRWSWERDPTTAPEPSAEADVAAEEAETEHADEPALLDPPTDELGADWFDGSLEPQPMERTPTQVPRAERPITWHLPAGIALVAVAMVASASVLALVW